MKSLRQLSVFSWLVLFAGGTALAPFAIGQSEKWPFNETGKSDPLCPTISVSCPSAVKEAEPITFTASIGGDPGTLLTYTWTVHGGTIIQGQGTRSIKVRGSRPLTATLAIGGLDPTCASQASCSLIPGTPPPPSTRFDSYGLLSRGKEEERLEVFATALQGNPGAQGYVLYYGRQRDVARAARAAGKRAKAYLVKDQGIDAQRIVIVEGGFNQKLTVDLWIVPTGAIPPKPEPAVDPGTVKLSHRYARNNSFASKVMTHVSFGSAARCAAVAVPRRHSRIDSGLCPWFGLSPSNLLGQRPQPGHSPQITRQLDGGA